MTSTRALDKGGENVLLKTFTIKFRDDDLEVELDLTGDLETLKYIPVTIKEGAFYCLEIQFVVQRKYENGLRLFNELYRKGTRVNKSSYMVGSYGPNTEVQTYVTPYEEAPKGMNARGTYIAQNRFTHYDTKLIFGWEWSFKIVK